MPMVNHPLGRSPLFAGFSQAEIAALLRHAVERTMVTGEVLFQRGDAGSSVVAILAGEVRIELPDPLGRIQLVRVMKVGEVFGELALFDRKPRSANVVAATNGRLLVIERASVLALMARDPAFAARVVEVLCERLRSTTAQLEALRFQDAGQRICAYLLQRLGDSGQPRIDITQAALAETIGATRETVNRRLAEFQAETAIARKPGRITILDARKLAARITTA